MTSRYKEQAKSLKGPDDFQVKVMTAMDWAVKHTKQIVLVLAPIALAAVGYLAWQKFQLSQRDTRLEELGKIQVVYENEERKAADQRTEIQKKVDAIDKQLMPVAPPAQPGADPAAAPAPAPAAPDAATTAKLTAEKAELEKQIAGVKATHTESGAQFQAFFKKHETSPEGWMAGMTSARILLDGSKLAEAAEVLKTVVTNSKSYPFYQTQARLSLIGVLEEQGNYDQALTELDALDKTVDKDLKPRVLLAKGRIQMLKSQNAEAKATFNTLIEGHGTSPEAQKARSIQALLN